MAGQVLGVVAMDHGDWTMVHEQPTDSTYYMYELSETAYTEAELCYTDGSELGCSGARWGGVRAVFRASF